MKKYMILAAGVILMTISANAQSNRRATGAQYLTLGPVAGIGHSWVSNMSDQTFKPSGYLGIELLYSQKEHWGFSTNLLVSHEGFATEYIRNGVNYRTAIDPVYLRMTPKAYYFFGNYGDDVRPKVFLGPSIAVKVAEDQYNTDDPISGETATMRTSYGTDYFNTVDLGAEAGLGVNVRIGRSTWFNIDGSYYHGLVNATAADNNNRNVKLDFGFMFGL